MKKKDCEYCYDMYSFALLIWSYFLKEDYIKELRLKYGYNFFKQLQLENLQKYNHIKDILTILGYNKKYALKRYPELKEVILDLETIMEKIQRAEIEYHKFECSYCNIRSYEGFKYSFPNPFNLDAKVFINLILCKDCNEEFKESEFGKSIECITRCSLFIPDDIKENNA